jgi:MFS family permease
MTPVAGRLSDIYGKKRVLLNLLAISIVGIVAAGFANNISFLLITRIIQGIGLAAVPAAFSLLRDTFPAAKLARAVGVFGSAFSAGSVVGLLIGAPIIQAFGWHATFLIIAPFAGIVTILIVKFVNENHRQRQQLQDESITAKTKTNRTMKKRVMAVSSSIDIKGIIALSATITSFLIALTLIETNAGSSLSSSSSPFSASGNLLQTIAAFAVSAISLTIFIIIERRVVHPFVELRLLKHKLLLPSYMMQIATGITLFMINQTIVQLVRSPTPLGFGGSAVDAANVQLPFMIMYLIFASIAPFIINKVGNTKPTIIGSIISLFGGLGLLMFHSTAFEVSLNLAILASGISLTMTATRNITVTSSPKEFTGISVAVGTLLLFIGMSIGPVLAGVYLQNHQTIKGIEGSSYPSPSSYNWIFGIGILLSGVSLASALILRKREMMNKELIA